MDCRGIRKHPIHVENRGVEVHPVPAQATQSRFRRSQVRSTLLIEGFLTTRKILTESREAKVFLTLAAIGLSGGGLELQVLDFRTFYMKKVGLSGTLNEKAARVNHLR
jgi:hypothetical protein